MTHNELNELVGKPMQAWFTCRPTNDRDAPESGLVHGVLTGEIDTCGKWTFNGDDRILYLFEDEITQVVRDDAGTMLIERLKTERPDVVIEVSRYEDFYPWDGDGPDPAYDGYVCCTVDVTAKAIRGGVMVEGMASLGSSYYLENEPCGEVHGYLKQMVEEALQELDAKVRG